MMVATLAKIDALIQCGTISADMTSRFSRLYEKVKRTKVIKPMLRSMTPLIGETSLRDPYVLNG